MIEKEEMQAETVEITQETEQIASPEPTPEKTYEIVGVRYKTAGKIYYFDPQGLQLQFKDHVIVETARGIEYGFVAIPNRVVTEAQLMKTISENDEKNKERELKGKEPKEQKASKEPKAPKTPKEPGTPQLRPILRIATDDDRRIYEENKRKSEEAKKICQQKINEHHLEMKLLDASYSFDNSRLYFYYSNWVDFRELLKSLAAIFRTRIEMRQVQSRDEAKIVGGIGVCGRPFCCKIYKDSFEQVSMKAVKEQNLSQNPDKHSGPCEKLMCCMLYEHDMYLEESKKMPKVDSQVETPDGKGVVCEVRPLAGIVRVKLFENHQPIRNYVYDQVKVIAPSKKEQKTLREADNKQTPVSEN